MIRDFKFDIDDQTLLDALDALIAERNKQNDKWGVQNHDDLMWKC